MHLFLSTDNCCETNFWDLISFERMQPFANSLYSRKRKKFKSQCDWAKSSTQSTYCELLKIRPTLLRKDKPLPVGKLTEIWHWVKVDYSLNVGQKPDTIESVWRPSQTLNRLIWHFLHSLRYIWFNHSHY
jgi:hypothetical protein